VRKLRDLGDLAGKRVLVRVDFNVPLHDGAVADDTRIVAALPTIEALRERGAALVLAAHLGRPQDREPELSLAPVAERLSELTAANVTLARGVVGEEVQEQARALKPQDILLLENVRYEPGETKNDEQFAAALAELADAYVNDAFGAAHRAHASTEGVAHVLPDRAAGLLLERELSALGGLLDDPARPLVAVLGGAKVTDKIGVIERFQELADAILIGGAMCFPFLAAEGHAVGDSLCESEDVELAKRALERSEGARATLELPVDLIIAPRLDADVEASRLDGVDVPDGMMGLDIGPATAEAYASHVASAGPFGLGIRRTSCSSLRRGSRSSSSRATSGLSCARASCRKGQLSPSKAARSSPASRFSWIAPSRRSRSRPFAHRLRAARASSVSPGSTPQPPDA